MTAGAVHTSAPADCCMQLTGILRNAIVAQKPIGDGRFVPTLVLDLDDVGAGHNHVEAHVTYRPGQEQEAEATAAQLRRGEPLTVTTQLADIRVLLVAASLSPQQP